ncbi:vWA domain-containing protein [Hyalangium rubrum]|uniref:VWA domain-containing protein n=1 Tax=Hyalangium rubrum TaxID=3103134 RepID=A0ABU5H3Z4_9BACT|nr:VWA domain-containing protein [Hyalangium sp. s54d21]MDY7227971.1 VWA domain-containing protein [Hyalangium sp. s54d21]
MIAWKLPWLLVLLAAVPVWLVWRRRQLMREAVVFPPLQLREVSSRTIAGGRVLLALEGAILGMVVVALAEPMETHEVELFEEEGIDLALVLDISATMQAADFPPNRLEVLKELSSELVRRSAGARVGVYAFAGVSMTQAPLTTDTVAVIDLIDALSFESINHYRAGGTAAGDALLLATDELLRLRVQGRDQVIVLVTDGESNQGIEPQLAARHLKEQGVRLYVIGIGQEVPVKVWANGVPLSGDRGKQLESKLDDAQLRQIAAQAEGSYYRADSSEVLTRIFEQISRLEHKPLQAQDVVVERSRRAEVAFVLAALLALWFTLDGVLLRRPLR